MPTAAQRRAEIRVTVNRRQYSIRVPLDEKGSGRCVFGAFARRFSVLSSRTFWQSAAATHTPVTWCNNMAIFAFGCAGRPLADEVACSASICSDGEARFTVAGSRVSGAHCDFVLQRLENGEFTASFVGRGVNGSKVNNSAVNENMTVELPVGAMCRLAGVVTVKFDGVFDTMDVVDGAVVDGSDTSVANVDADSGGISETTAEDGGDATVPDSGSDIGSIGALTVATAAAGRAGDSDAESAGSIGVLTGIAAGAGDVTAMSGAGPEGSAASATATSTGSLLPCDSSSQAAVSATTGVAERSGDGNLAVAASAASISGLASIVAVAAGNWDIESAGTGIGAAAGDVIASVMSGAGPEGSAASAAATSTGSLLPCDYSPEASTSAVSAPTGAEGHRSGDGNLAVAASAASTSGQAIVAVGAGCAASGAVSTSAAAVGTSAADGSGAVCVEARLGASSVEMDLAADASTGGGSTSAVRRCSLVP